MKELRAPFHSRNFRLIKLFQSVKSWGCGLQEPNKSYPKEWLHIWVAWNDVFLITILQSWLLYIFLFETHENHDFIYWRILKCDYFSAKNLQSAFSSFLLFKDIFCSKFTTVKLHVINYIIPPVLTTYHWTRRIICSTEDIEIFSHLHYNQISLQSLWSLGWGFSESIFKKCLLKE